MSGLHKRFSIASRRAQNEAKEQDSDAGLSAQEAATPHDDDNAVKGMVRLFLDSTEVYASLIVQGGEQVRRSGQWQPDLTSVSSETCCMHTSILHFLQTQTDVSLQQLVGHSNGVQMLDPLVAVLDVCKHPDMELFKMAVWTVGKVAYSATLVQSEAGNRERLRQVYEQFVAVLSHRCRCAMHFHCTAHLHARVRMQMHTQHAGQTVPPAYV